MKKTYQAAAVLSQQEKPVNVAGMRRVLENFRQEVLEAGFGCGPGDMTLLHSIVREVLREVDILGQLATISS